MSDSFDRYEAQRDQSAAVRLVIAPARLDDLAAVGDPKLAKVIEVRHSTCGVYLSVTVNPVDPPVGTFQCVTGGCPGRWKIHDIERMSREAFAREFVVAPVFAVDDLPVWAIVPGTGPYGGRGGMVSRLMSGEEAAGYYRKTMETARAKLKYKRVS